MHGVPLSWHRRQGACQYVEARCGAGERDGVVTRAGRRGGPGSLVQAQKGRSGHTHVSFAPILTLPACRAGSRTTLGDVPRRDLRLLRWQRSRGLLRPVLHVLGERWSDSAGTV